MADDLHEFVEHLSKSQLLKSAALSLDEFIDQLLSQEVITLWQCEKLKRGQFKGFYIDDFLLFDFDHLDETRSYYVARNLKTNETVLLGVHPRGSENRVLYDVLPYQKD